MRKILFFLAFATMSFLCAAQNEVEAVADTSQMMPSNIGMSPATSLEGVLSTLSDPQNLGFADSMNMTPEKNEKEIWLPIQRPNKFLRKNYMRQSLDVSPSISLGKTTTQNAVEYDYDETKSTGWGLNFGYSLIFIPGREENEMLKLNLLGFAYGVGFIASFAQSDRYGTTCSFLTKLSFEFGSFHSMGFGFDVLGGGGKSPGDMLIFKNGLSEAEKPDKIVPYTAWCWQYGGQLWMKVNLIGSLIKNAETLVFARLVESVDPQVMKPFSAVHYNLWKQEMWFFGTTIRYSF